MDNELSSAQLEQPKEIPKKKEINFKELPSGTNELLNNKITQQVVDHFTQQNPISIPMDNYQNSTHLSLILSPNLREIEMMIKGLEYVKQYNPYTQKEEVVLKKIEGHALNEYGINKVMEFLKVFSSSELKLGRRTRKDAIESAQQIGYDARRLIYKNLTNFGMDNQIKRRSAKTYCLAIFEFAYSALSRSIEGMENDQSRPTAFEIQSNIDGIQDQNKLLTKQQKDSLKN